MIAFQIRLQCFVVKQSWEGVVRGYSDGGGGAARGYDVVCGPSWLIFEINENI